MSDPQNPSPNGTGPAEDAGAPQPSTGPDAPTRAQGQPLTGQDALNRAYGQPQRAGQPQQPPQPQQFAPTGAQPPQGGQIPPGGPVPPAGQIPPGGPVPGGDALMGGSVPAEKGRSRAVAIVSAILVVVLLAAAGLVINHLRTSHDATKDVGKCVTLSGSKDDVKTKRVDCSTAGSYYVAKAGAAETCTDVTDTDKNYGGTYDEITVQRSGSSAKMCLVPQLVEGSCYAEDLNDLTYQSIDCSDPDAYIRVDQIIEEYDATCPDTSTGGLTYDTPARTYCISQPE